MRFAAATRAGQEALSAGAQGWAFEVFFGGPKNGPKKPGNGHDAVPT